MKTRKEIIESFLRNKKADTGIKKGSWYIANLNADDIDFINETELAAEIDEALSYDSIGVELIAVERERQIIEEGYSATNDDYYDKGQLAMAATSYVWPHEDRPTFWPWDFDSWKPTPDDRIRELVKAGALIAAEIDRLKRLQKI